MKIRKRQREGIDTAKKENVRFGRPAVEKPENWDSIMNQIDSRQISVAQAIRQLNISRSSFYRLWQNNSF